MTSAFAIPTQQISTARWFFIIGAVVYPLFWLIRRDEGLRDPLWLRLAVSGLILASGLLVERVPALRRRAVLVGLGVLTILTAHLLFLTAVNRLSPFNILGIIIVASMASVVGGYNIRSARLSIVYLVGLMGSMVILGALVEEPRVDRWFAVLAVLTVGGMMIVATRFRMQAIERLRGSEERYILAAEGAQDALWDWDLRNDEMFFSHRWHAMLGEVGTDHLVASTAEWFDRVHSGDLDRLKSDLDALVHGRVAHLENEHRIRHRSGHSLWILTRAAAVRDGSGSAYRVAGSHRDVTERKALEAQLENDAYFDHLTGLPNRRQFADRLQRRLKRAEHTDGGAFAVLFLDLDRFKLVNDSLGHVAGDRLLVSVAERLSAAVRPGDVIARVSGDEFAILLTDIRNLADARRVADRILSTFADPFEVLGREVFASASIGIASHLPECKTAEDFIRNADLAMYRAKALGRHRHEVYDSDMHRSVVQRLSVESELRRAIERDEFCLFYQPICELTSGRVAGVEALLRWNHPERGLTVPADFLEVAEETGVLAALSTWTLRTACRDAAVWAMSGASAPTVSINVSSRQFWHPHLTDEIASALAETGLSPGNLAIEVTEGVLTEDVDQATRIIRTIRELGVPVHIDDFGRGYSSLSFLARYPVDALKIDRQFIASPVSGSWQIVEAVLALARSLNISAVAEGVETAAQHRRLVGLGCPLAQGFYFLPPVPAQTISDLTQGHDMGELLRPN